jgi:hypothetical protein
MKRTPPSREAPLRNASHAFRPSPPGGLGAAQDLAERAVEAAVGTAYRVYEEYVRWGRTAAAQQARSRHGRTTMKPRQPDTQAVTQWIQMWQEMFRMWISFMNPFATGMPGAPPFVPGPFGMGTPFGGYSPRNASAEFEIELETSQRVSLSLQLTDQSASGTLRAQLHREEGDGRIALEFDASSIRVALPDREPPGTYSGVVRDETGHQCGMMTLIVFGTSISA